MKLLSLSVEHFRCIRKARIEFSDGLNVLYGPNDLGKSSLAHAIRAALLMQANAAEHKEFVNWSGSGEPHVELVFETEPQRIWRVRKTFGRGESYLDESRNGVDFTLETRGREVDGRLSEILRWGLAPPGVSKGRPRGMPMTFLSNALLAKQDQVSAILDQALGDDSDESGKQQLIHALQAIAEDPLFKTVLARVQDHVDLAFTKTGGKKGGKNSPWTKLRDEMRQKEQRDLQCRQEAQKTSAIELEIQELRSRQLESKDALERAEGLVARLQEGLERERQRQEIVLRLEEHKARLAGIRGELAQLAGAEKLHADAAQRVALLVKREELAKAALTVAQARVQAANDELASLQNEDRARERLLKQSTLETQRADLRTEHAQNLAALERISGIEAAAGKVHSIEGEAAALAKSVADLKKKSDAAAKAVKDAEEQERELRAIGHLFRSLAAQTELEQAERGLAQVKSWGEEAARKRATAAALEEAQPRFTLPSPAQLEGLRKLEGDRRVATAKLDVGLTATLRPKRDLRVTVQLDGDETAQHDLADLPLEVDARRQMRFEIEDVAEIIFSGGARDARQEMERLESRWLKEVEPLLKAAGVASLDGFGKIFTDAARRSREIQDARSAATQLEQRMTDQQDWASLRAEREHQLATAEQALGDADRPRLEKAARKLEIADLAEAEKRLELLRAKHTSVLETGNKLNRDLAGANAGAAEKQRSLDDARAELVRAQSTIEGDWQEVRRNLAVRQSAIDDELRSIQTELAGLTAAEDQGLRGAQENVAACKRELQSAEAAHVIAVEQLNAANMAQAAGEGELKMRRERAALLDENAAREVVKLVEVELHKFPAPAAPITGDVVAEARKNAEAALLALKQIEDDIQAKRGALQQVGGDIAKQEAKDAAAALGIAREREHDVEVENEAWKLLQETLREAETEEGTHLGRTLAPPIATRFSELTAGRYGKLALGPGLETGGISVAGEDRDVSLLSVGTRDQLSTLFRLTLAEQLKSTILLDDQLTQTDAPRMLWLRELLRKVAGNIQVIVFTCRKEDYQFPQEQAVHSVDLVQVIDRF